MQPRAHEAGFLRQGPLRPDTLARSLEEWTTAQHRENVAHTLVYHAGELPPAVPATNGGFLAWVDRLLSG